MDVKLYSPIRYHGNDLDLTTAWTFLSEYIGSPFQGEPIFWAAGRDIFSSASDLVNTSRRFNLGSFKISQVGTLEWPISV